MLFDTVPVGGSTVVVWKDLARNRVVAVKAQNKFQIPCRQQ